MGISRTASGIWLLLAFSSALGDSLNVLSESEKAAGWQLMFDGKTLTGWHSYRKTGIPDFGWIVNDSAIYLRGPAAGALLAPEAFTYKNFQISIDWKLPDSGNSGIFLRYLETEDNANIRTGPETQICGRLHPDYRNGMATTSPGACYDMFAPSRPWIRSGEEYNTLQVVMYEDKVAHFGNGAKLLEYVIGDAEWKARYDSSKYRFFPLYGDIHAGKLFLQDHASHVWYRNIKIRPLASDPWADAEFPWPDQGTPVLIPRGRAAFGFAARRAGGGRIGLRSAEARPWDLRLLDPLGRMRGAFRGTGEAVLSDTRVPAGWYLIGNGTGGAPGASAIPLPAR
jgi:hypothetical protein